MAYTYDETILSDLYKDAWGFRPGPKFWEDWSASTPNEKQAIWDNLIQDVETEIQRQNQEDLRAVAEFEKSISDIQRTMGIDRNAAVRIYVDSLGGASFNGEKLYLQHGASWLCFEAGLPYSMAQVFVDAGVTTHIG